MKDHIYRNFKKLFGRKNNFQAHLREGAWENEVELSDLDEEFLEEEI